MTSDKGPNTSELHLSHLENGTRNGISQAWSQWLLLIILATREAEIRRITVRSQPRQIVRETLSKKPHHRKALVE
jgi:hypothetical protein